MVPLPTAAVVEDLVAAVRVANGAEPGGHLADRRVPVDLLVRAIVTATQRVQDALPATVLVEVEAQRLLTRVALRRRMILVAADPLERPPVGTEPHLDAAVALAQDAGSLVPRLLRCG